MAGTKTSPLEDLGTKDLPALGSGQQYYLRIMVRGEGDVLPQFREKLH